MRNPDCVRLLVSEVLLARHHGGRQVIPHDLASEAGALGSILCANGRAEIFLSQLTEEDFYDERHLLVFRHCLRLEADNLAIDQVNLVQSLKDTGQLENAGGFAFVASLPDATPSSENFPSYLSTLKDRTERRRLLERSRIDQARALDLTKPIAVELSSEVLEQRRFNPAVEPRPVRPVYTLAGSTICTAGNLTTITSAVKTGKSAVVGAMVASAMPHNDKAADCLGFGSDNPWDAAITWFDSEQSPVDFWHCVNRAPSRAGTASPAWLSAYCLTGLGHAKAWRLVKQAIRVSKDKCGAVHSIFLDGAADFVGDVNDAAEANDFVSELMALAIEHDCPLIAVIHFNPGSDKSRGHLGSQLERKAETNLALEKGSDESTVIYSTKNRRAGIPKDRGPRFKFSTQADMHVTVQSMASSKAGVERGKLVSLAATIFETRPGMRYTDLKTAIVEKSKVSQATAERRISVMVAESIIKLGPAGIYAIDQNTTA